MKRICFFPAAFIFFGFAVSFAQDTISFWKKGGNVGLNITQVALSNWAGGGQNTIGITGLTNVFANYAEGKTTWDNSLELGYGMTKLAKQEFRKSDDRILFTSKFGHKANDQFFYSALLDFRSQFDKGYKYNKNAAGTSDTALLISNLFAPAFMNVGVGMTYKPADYFEILVAPLSNRIIIVMDDELSKQGAFGVNPGKNIKSELGAALNIFFKKEILTNVTLQSRLNTFGAYEYLPSLVVTWESLLNMKVND
ncbi:MAG: DUF3078 domain-containing protein [Bacteroidetes bacterium]|nr:DUF3078 domain-containing protein [Bacteroidota bacterium]